MLFNSTTSLMFLFLLFPVASVQMQAQEAREKAATEPELLSIFPLGGKQHSTWQAEILGKSLEQTHAVWFDCKDLQAKVIKLDEIQLDPPKGDEKLAKKTQQRVLLEMRADASAQIGAHRFRLVSARGISNALSLLVNAEPSFVESQDPPAAPGGRQQVAVPQAIYGKIAREGEVDYYSFSVRSGQELSFEVTSGGAGFDPILAVFKPSGSWFDPDRLTRLAFNDDANSRTANNAKLTCRFDQSGQHVVAVGAFVGQGGLDYSYQLRIVPGRDSNSSSDSKLFAQTSLHSDSPGWRERDFSRDIGPDRQQLLWSRTVRVPTEKNDGPAPKAAGLSNSESDLNTATSAQLKSDPSIVDAVASVWEKEPNENPAQALEVSIPTIIEGTIERPGDIDCFKFQVPQGRALAFEVQALNELPSRFNPLLTVLNSDGQEVLTNIYKRIGGDGDDWVQSIEPKTLYTFEPGQYSLQVSDLTSRYGDSTFKYRVMIRPQIAHIGDVEVKEDRINLSRGEGKKLTVILGQEEGFGGAITVSVENLPRGVEAFSAAEVAAAEGPPFAKVHPERFVTKSEKVTLMLLASQDSPLTEMPHWVRVKVRPVVRGKPGDALTIKEIPVMIVEPSQSRPAIDRNASSVAR